MTFLFNLCSCYFSHFNKVLCLVHFLCLCKQLVHWPDLSFIYFEFYQIQIFIGIGTFFRNLIDSFYCVMFTVFIEKKKRFLFCKI